MPLGPREYDPANRVSPFAAAVGSAVSGFSGMQDYMAKRRQQAESEEDRQREIGREAEQDAERRYELGVGTSSGAPAPSTAPTPSATTPSAPSQPTPDDQQFGQGEPFGNPSGAMPASVYDQGGGGAMPASVLDQGSPSRSALASAVGAQLAGTDVTAPATAPAPAAPAQSPIQSAQPSAAVPPQQPGGGIRSRVGAILGRMGDNLSTGGYHGFTAPAVNVTRTGPSMKEREATIRETGENTREGTRAAAQRDVAAGNNRTAIQVANIAAGSREQVARAKAAQDQNLKVAMGAINNQIVNTDRAIKQLEDQYDKSEPGIADNSDMTAQKRGRQQRIQVQLDRLRFQRQTLAGQQQNATLAAAMGASDLSAYLPHPSAPTDPNDESQMSDAQLWEKKVRDGMPKEQATTYVRNRQRGP